jgi:O-antigen/teichoic acid export membrane protein
MPATGELSEFGDATPSSVVAGGLWGAASWVIPQAQILALSVISARLLGPDDFGRQSYIAFVALSLVLVATAGRPAALSRFTAELLGAGRPGAARALLGRTVRVELLGAAGAALVLVLVAGLGAQPPAAWTVAGVGAGLAVLQAAPAALLLGARRWRDATLPGLATGILSIPATWVVLDRGGGITGVIAVEATVIAVNLAWTAALTRRFAHRLGPPTYVPVETQRRFRHTARMSTVIVAGEFLVWRRSELFVLERLSSDTQLALYSIAFASVGGLMRVAGALTQVVTPAVATLVGSGGHDRIRSGFWRAARVLLLASPALAAATVALGPELLRVVYGPGFRGVGTVVLVLAVPMPLLPLLTMSSAALFGLGRVRFLVVTGLAAAIVDLGLALALVAPLDATGAAIANGAAQLVAGLPALVLAARLLAPVDLAPREVARPAVTAAAGGVVAATAVAALGGVPGVAAGLLLGAVIWALGIALLRPVRPSDVSWLASAIGGFRSTGPGSRP